MSNKPVSNLRLVTTLVIVAAFLLLLTHSIFAEVTSPHCSNYYNRSCSAQIWKVWEW